MTRFGVYRVIGTVVLKVGLSGMALRIGHRHAVFVGVFAVATRVLTEVFARRRSSSPTLSMKIRC